jgi:sugar phosphate permease
MTSRRLRQEKQAPRLACRGDGTRRDRAARDLYPRQLPGIALSGARAAPQAAHLGNTGAWRHGQRRGQQLVRQGKSGGIRQVFLPDVLPATLVALFVACSSTCIYGTVGSWMPLYLATEKYSLFYVFYGICGFIGLCTVGWLIDRIGRRRTFIVTLIEGAIFMTLWVYSESHVLLWAFGLAWSLGFLGFWGPSTTLTAEVFPTRIRGAANGVVWADRLLRRLCCSPL